MCNGHEGSEFNSRKVYNYKIINIFSWVLSKCEKFQFEKDEIQKPDYRKSHCTCLKQLQ